MSEEPPPLPLAPFPRLSRKSSLLPNSPRVNEQGTRTQFVPSLYVEGACGTAWVVEMPPGHAMPTCL